MARGLKRIKVPVAAATTVPGTKNRNGQVVEAATGWPSASFPGQRVYRMRCEACGFEYGANGCDVHTRLCPSHQGGRPGEVLPERGPSLF